MWIATAAQSREIDRRAIHERGIPSRILMERAGNAVFEAVSELLTEGGKLAILCGPGNNGGDGFVVARLAKENGYCIDCLVAADDETRLSPDAKEQLDLARAAGAMPIFASEPRFQGKLDCLGCKGLIVDALLGTGARSEVRGVVKEAILAINRSGVPTVAVDVPSGIACDTGEELGESVWALRTVTFGLPKRFLFQGIGLEHSGYWSVADIGFPEDLLQEPTEAMLIDRNWVSSLLPERLRASHKGDNGAVLIVAGSLRMRGAAVLSAMGALGVGAGLVTVAGIDEVCDAVAAQVPEALLLPLPGENGRIAPSAAPIVLAQMSKCEAAVFGPGMTHDAPVVEFLGRVWKEWDKPCVVDADALNAVANGLDLPGPDCILTPHPGEMARLLRTTTAEVQSDRFATVQQARDATGKCVLFKGAHTIVGSSEHPMLVNPTGNPGMASGGMGDVLSGMLATLMAQSLPDALAAGCGMFWHGYAANLCADLIGPFGYKASDVATMLPQARARMVQP
ncbi:MAG TPA: NAD(P)H-hydrate dehydratase [Fimbriimonas sp.]